MMKLKFSQRSINGGVPASTKSTSSTISTEICSHIDDHHWQSDDNSSNASSNLSVSVPLSGNPKNKRVSTTRDSSSQLPPPILVYHESARSIVFRDNMHRACDAAAEQVASILTGSIPNPYSSSDRQHGHNGTRHASFLSQDKGRPVQSRAASVNLGQTNKCLTSTSPIELTTPTNSGMDRNSSNSIEIKGFQPQIVPLPRLQLGRNDEFQPLISSDESQQKQFWTDAEKRVYEMIMNQKATVKTIKNSDWTQFLHRFKIPKDPSNKEHPNKRDDIGPHCLKQDGTDQGSDSCDSNEFPYNSFVTSTTLLPAGGVKMRTYGTTSNYTTGVVFAMPEFENEQLEDEAAKASNTWSWPAGYSAKTEFNINSRGELINGRAEALVPISELRTMNNDYLSKKDYLIGGRIVDGGLKTVPYNEVFLRVGGKGRSHFNSALLTEERSFDKGVGLPVAIFCRTASFGHLFSLLRTRARMLHTFGETQMKGVPLMMITPDLSIRVLTENLQHKLLKVAAQHLNPFQNSMIAHKTKIDDTDPAHMQTKLEELIDLDDKLRETLTKEELVRIAGGFGATDDSVAKILRDAMVQDTKYTDSRTACEENYEERHSLQDIVNEGLAASVRASDYYTSRQLLILYSLVSSESGRLITPERILGEKKKLPVVNTHKNEEQQKSLLDSKVMLMRYSKDGDPNVLQSVKKSLLPRPPPPPLDTDRLRSATNSDGLLAVLGAAQILRAMQDGGAKIRTKESWEAVEEWIEHGERNIAFRLASWRDQRAAQDDLEIAVDQDSSFMAFVSGKAISNRKKFAIQLHEAVEQTDFNDMRFLLAIDEITSRMHAPCLRLELLQYVLGLDNRYSIAHVKRAVELAATCLNFSCKSEQ